MGVRFCFGSGEPLGSESPAQLRLIAQSQFSKPAQSARCCRLALSILRASDPPVGGHGLITPVKTHVDREAARPDDVASNAISDDFGLRLSRQSQAAFSQDRACSGPLILYRLRGSTYALWRDHEGFVVGRSIANVHAEQISVVKRHSLLGEPFTESVLSEFCG